MVDGFDQVVIKAGLMQASAVLVLVALQRRDEHGIALLLPERLRDLVTVKVRKSDIEENELGMKNPSQVNRLGAVVGCADLVPEKRQEPRCLLGGVETVVDNEDPRRGLRRERGRSRDVPTRRSDSTGPVVLKPAAEP